MFGPGQFDDASEDGSDGRMHDDLDLSEAARLSRLSASSRALAYATSSYGARPRTSETTAQRMEAAAFMTMLGNNDGVDGGAGRPPGALAAASPYYQRQPHASPYHRPYPPQQGAYAAMHSPGDAAGLAHFSRRPGYGYPHGAGGSPEQRHAYHPHYAVPPQASPSHRDFGAYYRGRQAQELSQAALLERQYALHQRDEEDMIAAAMLSGTGRKTSPASLPSSSRSYLSKPSTKPASKSTPRASRGGRGGRGGRGRGSGRGGRGGRGARKASSASKAGKDRPISPPSSTQRWYAGCVPLGLPEDKYWLSELQVYLRSNFAEAFGATEQDIAAPMHGRNKPIALGQVGIRCMHCKNDQPSERGQQATSYPSLISGIYNSVQQMLRLHFDCCFAMPTEVRQKIEALKVSSSARGGRKQYWIDSAKRLGLVDTPHGIHFGRDPHGPLPPLAGPSVSTNDDDKKATDPTLGGGADASSSPPGETSPNQEGSIPLDAGEDFPKEDTYPLVVPEDIPLISDYLYLTLEQMQPCNLMEADKVGCYKAREVGFPGLACKHCVGQAGCGRYFPASEASLSQTTTSQTIMNHVRNCRRCPIEIRENLELMKRARMGPDGKRADKPKHGGRKVFFHRLWCRIQRLPLEDEETGKKKGSGTWARQKRGGARKSPKRRNAALSPDDTSSSELDEHDLDDDGDAHYGDSSSEEETETEDESDSSDEEADDDSERSSDRAKPSGSSARFSSKSKRNLASGKKKPLSTWHEGCVRLTKTDDPHWLSEMHCYVRSELVEVFSLTKKDSLAGCGGRKEPAVGQVGVRCVFCKMLDEVERPSGFMYFPDSLSSIHTKIDDLVRLHFPSCPAMPDDVKETFKSLRGFGAKAIGDSQQYWIDSARDIGLANIPPAGAGVGWGITFRRDPLQPSPADELDRENVGAATTSVSKSYFVRAEDRGLCTDHVTLLLRQVKPCRFKKSDRRGGPGARGRDRVMGYPGLCCKHCITKNNFGRYFPVSPKNLTDNAANSLQVHVGSCSRCPEPIKASLAYLSHRSVLQKAELSGSWKKSFFRRVWDRLHVERDWMATDNADLREEESASSSSGENNDDIESRNGIGSSPTDSEDEELGEDMSGLIKAAAIWLSEQDESSESLSRTRARGRGLPGKRPLPFATRGRGGRGGLTSKRRRVHF